MSSNQSIYQKHIILSISLSKGNHAIIQNTKMTSSYQSEYQKDVILSICISKGHLLSISVSEGHHPINHRTSKGRHPLHQCIIGTLSLPSAYRVDITLSISILKGQHPMLQTQPGYSHPMLPERTIGKKFSYGNQDHARFNLTRRCETFGRVLDLRTQLEHQKAPMLFHISCSDAGRAVWNGREATKMKLHALYRYESGSRVCNVVAKLVLLLVLPICAGQAAQVPCKWVFSQICWCIEFVNSNMKLSAP